jgi:hypothetical protein
MLMNYAIMLFFFFFWETLLKNNVFLGVKCVSFSKNQMMTNEAYQMYHIQHLVKIQQVELLFL